jgi:integrase
MSIRNIETKSTYMEWSDMLLLLNKLETNREYKMVLLITICSFTGLIYRDYINLKWKDLINRDYLIINDDYAITINSQLKKIVDRIFYKKEINNLDEYIFINKSKTKPFRIQYVNRKLKEFNITYGLNIQKNRITTHTFRKTFGRRVWEMNNYTIEAINKLSEIFNHNTTAQTKNYLEIHEIPMKNIYENL